LRNVALWGLAWAVALVFTTAASAEETTYRKHIKPLFDAKCARCHGGDCAPELGDFKEAQAKWMAQGKAMRMDTYSHLVFYTAWPDTGALMRRLDDGKGAKDAKPGNMYLHLGKTEEERQQALKVFKDWVGNWTLKRWKDVTREELEGIKVTY